MLLGKKRKEKVKNSALKKANAKHDGLSSYHTGLQTDTNTEHTQFVGSPDQTTQRDAPNIGPMEDAKVQTRSPPDE